MLQQLETEDSRVRLYVNGQNRGMAWTTQSAIQRSSGEYVYRAESDDVCHPRFLESMVRVLDDHPQVGFVYCRALNMDANGNVWGGRNQGRHDFVSPGTDFFRSLILGNFVPGPNIVFSRIAHDRVGGFDVGRFRVACDWHFSLRMCLHSDVGYVAEPLGYHRVHSDNLSGALGRTYDLDLLFHESYELLEDVFGSVPQEHSELQKLRPQAMRRITIHHAAPLFTKALIDGRGGVANRILAGVKRYDPESTRGLAWPTACVKSIIFNLAYSNLYRPLAQALSRRRRHSFGEESTLLDERSVDSRIGA